MSTGCHIAVLFSVEIEEPVPESESFRAVLANRNKAKYGPKKLTGGASFWLRHCKLLRDRSLGVSGLREGAGSLLGEVCDFVNIKRNLFNNNDNRPQSDSTMRA